MKDDEIDALLNEDEEIMPVVEIEHRAVDLKIAESIGGDFEGVKADAEILFELHKLLGDHYPIEFTQMSNTILARYKTFPLLDFEKIYEELEVLGVRSEPTPTLHQINSQLQQMKSAKERLSEIVYTIIPSHTFKKRAVELLKDSWQGFSKEKGVVPKKADATFRISQFEQDYMATDSLYKAAMHIAKNLESTQEILSRRITIAGLQLKINDHGRHHNPDNDYGSGNGNSGSLDNLMSGDETEAASGIIPDAEVCDF